MPAYTTDTGESTGRRQTVATVVLVLLAVALPYLPTAQQQQIASLLRSTVLLPFVSTQRGITEARSRTTDTGVLRRQLDSLAAVLSGQRTLAEENRRLRGLLDLGERLGGGYVPASVVRSRTNGSESLFLLDVGAVDGVEVYSPVITRQGLVGVVREVRDESAIGIDWTHPDFRASAMDAAGLTYGIAESRQGEFREEDRLQFNGTAFHTRLEDGTVVVTSGLGATYPRGIPVGKVEGLAEADAGWRKSYWLRPMVEPGSVTHVLVGTGVGTMGDLSAVWPADSVMTEAELVLLEQRGQDSLNALGDSVELLRTILLAPRPVRDSLLATLLLGTAPPAADSAEGAPGADPARTAPVASPPAGPPPGPAPPRGEGGRPATGAGTGTVPRRFPPPTDTLRLGAPSAVDTVRRDTTVVPGAWPEASIGAAAPTAMARPLMVERGSAVR